MSGSGINLKKNFYCFSQSARHGLHIGRSENMAAVVRLLPSIRPQMASLTRPLLIFQPALCGYNLKKSSRGKKWCREKGVFRRQRHGSLAEITAKYSLNNRFPNTSSGEVVCRCSPGAHQQWVSEFSCQYYMFEIFDTHWTLPYPSLGKAVLPLHTPLHIFTRLCFLPPCAPPLSSMCRGQSQIYNNCQSQGWQIN